MFKVATWNVNSLRVRLPQVLDWLAEHQPDILALQETKLPDQEFPMEAISEAGYHAFYAGQKTYNGVAVLSKTQCSKSITDLPDLQDPQRRVLGLRYHDLFLLNLYVPNGAALGSDKFDYKLNWLEALHSYLDQLSKEFPKLIVMGDFNIAPEDRDVHDPAAWEGKVLVSEPERKALQRILEIGLTDSFRLFDQPQETFSWWDYRAGAFRRNRGLRIDLILVSQGLAARCRSCSIDKEARRVQRPSDHAPVVSNFNVGLEPGFLEGQ